MSNWLHVQTNELNPKLEHHEESRAGRNLISRLDTENATHEQRQFRATSGAFDNFQEPVANQQPQKNQVAQPVRRKRGPASGSRERACKVPPPAAGKRSSIYRGVTRHRWTGRYEAHLWDKSTWNPTQNKKGKQVYLGAYDDEEAAARAYDLAALKYWGPGTLINFPVTDYTTDIEEMQNVTREEYLATLRRKSSGFSRGVSKYRGVARHHHNGRWEARIGRVFGNKYLYLGTYSTQEEAAAAYDMAAIEYRGLNAVTNFDLSRYIRWLRPGATLPQEHQDATKSNIEYPSPSQDIPEVSNQQVWPGQQQTQDLSYLNNDKRSASPTALGLLLQSSMFRQMVERTSSRLGDEQLGSIPLETYTFLQSGSSEVPGETSSQPNEASDEQGLSLWNTFGGANYNLNTLPLTNAIGC